MGTINLKKRPVTQKRLISSEASLGHIPHVMDRALVNIGFEHQDVKRNEFKGILYIGIVYFFGLTTAFLIMTVLG